MTEINEGVIANIATTIKTNTNKLLFFSGSNSLDSINQQLIVALAAKASSETSKLIDLKNFPMPLYSDMEEDNGIPTETTRLQEIIDDYNLLVIAVPEHNHAMPAFFKNTIDWLSRARRDYKVFTGKKIILLNTSPGRGGNHILNTGLVLEVLGATIIGSAILSDFYKHTTRVNKQIQITDTKFLSEFENLIASA